MRHRLFGLGLLLPLFLGCSGENIVAGREKTKSEQLESALVSWCPSTCERLRACPQDATCYCSPGDACESCIAVDDGCEKQCAAAFAPYTDAGDTCAAIGQRIKACIDGVRCEDLGGEDPCRASDAELSACPDPNELDSDDVSPTVGNPYGDTGSAAGPVNRNPVTCSGSSAAGGGAPAAGGAQVTCEEERGGCSDGHVYSWICSQDSQGQRACACLVDSQATASFVPNSSDCPLLAQVNAGCAWALTP